MEMIHRAAVLGAPIEHSLSPVLHNAGYAAAGLADWEYTRMLCEADQLSPAGASRSTSDAAVSSS